jgi:hypothetical protein
MATRMGIRSKRLTDTAWTPRMHDIGAIAAQDNADERHIPLDWNYPWGSISMK